MHFVPRSNLTGWTCADVCGVCGGHGDTCHTTASLCEAVVGSDGFQGSMWVLGILCGAVLPLTVQRWVGWRGVAWLCSEMRN